MDGTDGNLRFITNDTESWTRLSSKVTFCMKCEIHYGCEMIWTFMHSIRPHHLHQSCKTSNTLSSVSTFKTKLIDCTFIRIRLIVCVRYSQSSCPSRACVTTLRGKPVVERKEARVKSLRMATDTESLGTRSAEVIALFDVDGTLTAPRLVSEGMMEPVV